MQRSMLEAMTSLTYSVNPSPNPTSEERLAEILANPGFGQHFTDHMVAIDWNEEKGWHDAQVRTYVALPMDPSTTVLHYGQSIFEGIKAYRQADGSVATFRPERNGERLMRSAERLAMPQLPVDDFMESLRQLVEIDQAWVPARSGEHTSELHSRCDLVCRLLLE